MRIVFYSLYSIFIISCTCFAQGNLFLHPNSIEFKNDFDRLKNVYFVNESADTVSIDSIHYENYNFYFLRFDIATRLPFKIPPYDSVKMDCILTSYYPISPSDTLDTMSIYNSGEDGIQKLSIKIDYFDEKIEQGIINGYVTENGNPVENAEVYFLWRNDIVKMVNTNSSGFYSTTVTPGTYTAAARKDSFYLTFYGQKFDPLEAHKFKVLEDSTKNIDINLLKMKNTGLGISGKVFDYVSSKTLFKGMIVSRRGRHTPSKTNTLLGDSVPQSFTAIINSDGSYALNNIIDQGFYVVQAFSDYYLPTYYGSGNPIFWQDADSINFTSSLPGINIFMHRDSSIGGGTISGNILTDQDTTNEVLIFAESSDNNFFNYTIAHDDGSFTLSQLPFGSYRLVAQKIGFEDAESSTIKIDSSNKNVSNVLISFDLASTGGNGLIPISSKLFQNYPNPFNPSTVISFYLAASSRVSIKIYDILGSEIAVLVDERLPAGNHEITFSAVDANGTNLASGIYFYRISASRASRQGFTQTKKMIFLR